MALKKIAEHKLQLGEVLEGLIVDGLLDMQRGRTLLAVASGSRQSEHPLTTVAHHRWPDARNPQQLLDLETLCEWQAAKAGLPYVRIDPLKIDIAAITGVMSYAYAKRFNILALEVSQGEITIATAEPFVEEWARELARLTSRTIKRVMADPEKIANYLVEFYSLSRSVRSAVDDSRQTTRGGIQNLEQLMELGKAGKLDADDQHIVNIVDWLLSYAYTQRASDIHIEPRREQTNVRFRIDGVMQLVYQIPAAVGAAVTTRIKILGRMDISEKRRPQDGRLKTRNPQGTEVELRLSTMPTAFGEKLVMRIFDPDVLVKDYLALGFSQTEMQQWSSLITHPHGIILVTGPTGSGKTTTLYTTLKELAKPEVNVCTIEDPIELVEPSFNQMQVQQSIALDFASGVRTLLRQDPDIIMIGEVRDEETAAMAVQAALTGHLVFSTLHTNDAPAAVSRLLEIGVPAYLIKATVLGVLGQRLVRLLCPHCKEEGPVNQDQWESLVSPWKIPVPKKIYHAVGCLECRQTGYLGRIGIYEMMLVTPSLKKFITAEADIQKLRRQAIAEGMRPLRITGAQKVANGLTTIEEVIRVVPPESEDV